MQPTQPMDDILTALAKQDDELDGLLAGLDEAGWARPSRCPGWTVADVVLHLAQTAEMTVASAERRFNRGRRRPSGTPPATRPAATVDDLAGLAVGAERGSAPGSEGPPAVAGGQRGAGQGDGGLRGPAPACPWVAGATGGHHAGHQRGWQRRGSTPATSPHGIGRHLNPEEGINP